jgi:hypothetical protein
VQVPSSGQRGRGDAGRRQLDRLSRNAAFLLTLRGSGVKFAAVGLPEANGLTVGIVALVAQTEREAISTRPKSALAVARSCEVKLGSPRRCHSSLPSAGARNRKAIPPSGGQETLTIDGCAAR